MLSICVNRSVSSVWCPRVSRADSVGIFFVQFVYSVLCLGTRVVLFVPFTFSLSQYPSLLVRCVCVLSICARALFLIVIVRVRSPLSVHIPSNLVTNFRRFLTYCYKRKQCVDSAAIFNCPWWILIRLIFYVRLVLPLAFSVSQKRTTKKWS